MNALVKNMVRKAPPPGAFGKSDDDEEYGPAEAEDEGEAANAESAYEEFARLAGFKPSAETFAAFKEAVSAVMRPEHRRLHPDDFK